MMRGAEEGDARRRIRNDALGRSRAYALFSALFREGLTEALWPMVRTLPDLAMALPHGFDADEAAADHYRLFGFNVFPYASLFLEREGRLGGAVTAGVRDAYQAAGYSPDLSAEAADHAAHEMGFMAFLSRAEADAREAGATAGLDRLLLAQRAFVDTHLAGWFPSFVQAVRKQSHPFYRALVEMALELLLAHRAALGPERGGPVPTLPPASDLLDDARTGLREIAGFLSTPALCGLLLSRDDVGRLARAESLPRGFGGRALMLGNLLRAAAEYGRGAALFDELSEEVVLWRSHFEHLIQADVPGFSEAARLWAERLSLTEAVLSRLRMAAATEQGRGAPGEEPN